MFMGSRLDGGLKLEEHQILQMEKLFSSGMLNQGTNLFNENHGANGKGSKEVDQIDYNYNPNAGN